MPISTAHNFLKIPFLIKTATLWAEGEHPPPFTICDPLKERILAI
jgi:hypothetical protein